MNRRSDLYFELIQDLPKPTEEQTKNFLHKFSEEHSWYKHFEPERTSPVVFYLDPNAHRTLVDIHRLGSDNFVFDPPTDEIYTSKEFGHWNYYTDNYTFNFLGRIKYFGINLGYPDPRPYVGLTVIGKDGYRVPVPEIVKTRGQFLLSRHIHPMWLKTEMMKIAMQERRDLFEHLLLLSDWLFENTDQSQ